MSVFVSERMCRADRNQCALSVIKGLPPWTTTLIRLFLNLLSFCIFALYPNWNRTVKLTHVISEIIGQQEIKKRLIRTVAEQRIPHAQLLRGPEGVGKLGLAIAYAQYICCENRTETDSCGVCASCVKYKKLAQSRFAFCFPGNKTTKQDHRGM